MCFGSRRWSLISHSKQACLQGAQEQCDGETVALLSLSWHSHQKTANSTTVGKNSVPLKKAVIATFQWKKNTPLESSTLHVHG